MVLTHCVKCGSTYNAMVGDGITDLDCQTCKAAALKASPTQEEGRGIPGIVIDFFTPDNSKIEAAGAAEETVDKALPAQKEADLDPDIDLDIDLDIF